MYEDTASDTESEKEPVKIVRDELVNPYWMEDPDIGDGPVGSMAQSEVEFFQVSNLSSSCDENYLNHIMPIYISSYFLFYLKMNINLTDDHKQP